MFAFSGFAPSAGWAAPLFDSDFGQSGAGFEVVQPSGASAKGALPPGWDEQSTWQSGVRLNYSPVEVFGKKGLRIANAGTDYAQLFRRVEGLGLQNGALYELTVVARNPGQLDLRFAVRDNADPWTTHWSAKSGFGDEWQTFQTQFSLPQTGREVGFYIFVTGTGFADIASVRLDEIRPEEIAAQKLARFPLGALKNLMSRTRFPLGPTSGWSLEAAPGFYAIRDFNTVDATKIEPSGEIGPSGAPALRVSIPDGANPHGSRAPILWAPPFEIVHVGQKHVASVWVKNLRPGSARGTVQVKRDYWPTLGERVILFDDTQWHRLEIPFEPGVLGQVWSLCFVAMGDFLVDGFQVERGEHATEYQSRAEVDLAMPLEGEAVESRIHFADETPSFRWFASGAQAGQILEWRARDWRDQTVAEGKFALENGNSSGQLAYGRRPNVPLGPIRVEARIGDGHWSELVITRLQRPRFWGQFAPDSPFGGHFDGTRRMANLAKSLGVNWVRLHDSGAEPIKWISLEAEKGRWIWNDALIHHYRDAKIEILGGLQTTPAWASTDPDGTRGHSYYDQFFLPADLESWREYVRKVATRYPFILTWDVWNEPWGFGYTNLRRNREADGRGAYLRPTSVSHEYAKLVEAAREELQKIDPQKRVVWDADVRPETSQGQAQTGAPIPAEVFGYHLYAANLNGFPGDVTGLSLRERREKLAHHFAGQTEQIPLWMTEGSGTSDRQFSGIYRHTTPPSYTLETPSQALENATRSARFSLSLLHGGAQKVFLYTLGEATSFGSKKWLALTTEDGFPHLSAASHAALAYFLEGTHPMEKLEVARGVWAYGFQSRDKKRAVAVLSSAPKATAFTPTPNQKIRRFDLFGNAILGVTPFDERLEFWEFEGSWEALKIQLQ